MCVRSDAAETVIHSADAFAPVGYLRFTEMRTENKDAVSQTSEGIHECNLFLQIRSMLFNAESIISQQKFGSHFGVDYFKTCSEGEKETQEQNLLVSDNFVEQKRNTAL